MKYAALILAAVACLTACKHTVSDSGCIIRYTGAPYYTPGLKTGQLDTINALFSANGLPTANLKFMSYYSGTAKDSSGTPYLLQGIGASLSLNGLPVFYSSFSWSFRNGILQPQNSYGPGFAYPGSDTSTTWTLPALRSQFFKSYEAALYSKNNGRTYPMARPGVYYHDSCIYAQLGYLDAAWQPNSGRTYGKSLLKVWRLVPANPDPPTGVIRMLTPIVFVIDSTGFAWCPSPNYPGQPIPIDFTLSQ